MNNRVIWKQVSRDYVKNLNNASVQILIYNPITKSYKLEYADSRCIANSKHAEPRLEYYVLSEVY